MTRAFRWSGLAVVALTAGACIQTAVTRETLRPIPEHAARADKSPDVRGTAQAARRLPEEQQVALIAQVVRVFYRPLMTQARWIDPRPLAHARTRLADSASAPDPDWAIAISQATGLRRVCPLDEANAQCQGREGGVLRFSAPYVVGGPRSDSALIYVEYTPRSYGVAGEMEFFMARRDSVWQIVSRRAMPSTKAEGTRPTDVVDTQRAAEELLAADRAVAAAAASTDLVTALGNMFVGNVMMQAPGGFVRGRDAAIAALAANADNPRSKITWTPIGGGTSSGGTDGFTYGYMTTTRPDGTTQPGKYVAYWVRQALGWRIAVYRRVQRPAGDVALTPHALSVATRALPAGDSATVQRYADELSLAEHAFSREAQSIGLGAAFAKFGAPAAVNVGNGAEFVRGPEAIGRSIDAGWTPGTKVEWGPNEVIVARTGDLGVTIGTIRIDGTREVPFFTIWRRNWPTDPWRYIAE